MRPTVIGKTVLFGAGGQLAFDLEKQLADKCELIPISEQQCDITDASRVRDCLNANRPTVVINAAAYTNVDGCESDPETAFAVNADGPAHIAGACRELDCRLIHFSTDYVFDGASERAYRENDEPNPQTVYGQSKLEGERRVADECENSLILRIAWLYGLNGRNFVKTMLKLGREKLSPIKVVDDQFGNPTWSADVARQVVPLLESDLTGIAHATSQGEVSWYGFACDIFELVSMEASVEPCTSAEYPRPAPRPARSSLENSRLTGAGLNLMRNYRQALEQFLRENRGELGI